MTKFNYKNIALELLEHVEQENLLGYDPYDFYLSPLAKYFPKSIYFLHFFKFFPLNFRPVLDIKKGMVTKVYALMIDSYLNLYELDKERIYLDKALRLYKEMISAAVVDTDDELGWGRNYPFKTGGEVHDNKKPLVYLDARLGQAMIHLYDITKDTAILKDLKRVVVNIIRTGRILQHNGWKFIGYSPDNNARLTFNASMVAVETILKFMDRAGMDVFYVDEYEMRAVCYDIIRTMIHFQENDGSWIYGYSSDGRIFNQKDFHQGFVIDSLYEVLPLISDVSLRENAKCAYEKGFQYLKTIQISEKGEFFWRYPQKYPIDIHNQAQGILSLAKNKDDKNKEKLMTIVDYTVSMFWLPQRKCFAYQKWPIIKNKISYVRWCNAWMLYAMSFFVKTCRI
ncbi:MAG: hypothetical protein J6X18_09495 [Bacteroidales bacterium]|nr:hypothetical protein [Bacteroidales bacterium]